MYTLYVIPGSHACRSAILMLEHKRVPYRLVRFPTGLHPVFARLHGFTAGGQRRSAGGRRTAGLRFGDLLGTVPGLACDGQRISTNHGIARFLERRHPDPPLFPPDPGHRRAVEEAERWANTELQMEARRILAGAVLRDPVAFSRSTGEGRMGYLLYRRALTRRVLIPRLGPVFNASLPVARQLEQELPATLDRIDALITTGVIGGPELNVADFMIVPSLALILYRTDLRPLFEGRPALELLDRLLPDPRETPRARAR